MSDNNIVTKENLKLLMQGELPLDMAHEMCRMPNKDEDRFRKYIEILQEMVPWDDRILVRVSEHLFVVAKDDGQRIVKCDCGHEYGDYRVNWKLNALVYVRRTQEDIAKVFTTAAPDADYVDIREFYCPGCQAQLAVEVVPTGYPFVFEVLPDIDGLYENEGKPLPDGDPGWFQDLTPRQTAEWVGEGK